MNHETINKEALPYMFVGPDRTDQINARLKAERTAARELKDSWAKHTAEKNVELLEEHLERSKQNDRARAELDSEIAGRAKATADAIEEKRLAALVDSLRSSFLEVPGATEESFERALPRLLERKAEDAALQSETKFNRQMAAAKASGKYSI